MRPSKSLVIHLYFSPRWAMTAFIMSGSNPTISLGLLAARELNGGKYAEVASTYVLPLPADAALELAADEAAPVVAAEAALELEPPEPLLPQAATRTTAAAASAPRRRRVAKLLIPASPPGWSIGRRPRRGRAWSSLHRPLGRVGTLGGDARHAGIDHPQERLG